VCPDPPFEWQLVSALAVPQHVSLIRLRLSVLEIATECAAATYAEFTGFTPRAYQPEVDHFYFHREIAVGEFERLESKLESFPTFDYDPSLSPATSYANLREHEGWRRGSAASGDAWNRYQD
jgi:hypothetical protein